MNRISKISHVHDFDAEARREKLRDQGLNRYIRAIVAIGVMIALVRGHPLPLLGWI